MREQTNPYAPPTIINEETPGWSVLRMVGQLAILAYGTAFTSLVVWATYADFREDTVLEMAFWFPVFLCFCFGVFAYAIPPWQTRLVAKVWRYAAFALPVILLLGAAWHLAHDEAPLPPVDFAIALGVFLMLVLPRSVFNDLLHRKLNTGDEESI